MTDKEERNQIILNSLGKLGSDPIIKRMLVNGATIIQEAEAEYRRVVSERIEYDQCAYGL